MNFWKITINGEDAPPYGGVCCIDAGIEPGVVYKYATYADFDCIKLNQLDVHNFAVVPAIEREYHTAIFKKANQNA